MKAELGAGSPTSAGELGAGNSPAAAPAEAEQAGPVPGAGPVIVRIATEGQYEIGDDDVPELNELDNEAVAACDGGDGQHFHESFARLLAFVRDKGQPVGDDGSTPRT